MVGTLTGLWSGAGPVCAIGVGVAAVVDSQRGEVIIAPNLLGPWTDYRLAEELMRCSGVRTVLANDARCFALAEWRLGAARGLRDAIFVTLGTGVGGAVVAGGVLQTGFGGHAGEIGHVTIDDSGPRCGCGGQGHVEVYASGPAIALAASRAVAQGRSSSLGPVTAGVAGTISPEAVLAAATDGDPLAVDVLFEAAVALGRGLAPIVLALQPEVVVIGGGLAACVELLAPAVRSAIAERVRLFRPPRILGAQLGRLGGAIGAALWAGSRISASESTEAMTN